MHNATHSHTHDLEQLTVVIAVSPWRMTNTDHVIRVQLHMPCMTELQFIVIENYYY